MNIRYLKIFLPALTGLGLVFASASNTAFAWQKDGGADCSRVFASIRNESQTMPWDGYVKANNSIVVSDSGTAAPYEWKTISWTPPSGFEGNVEAVSRLKKSNGDVADYTDAVGKCQVYGADGVMIGRGIFQNVWAFDRHGVSHMDDPHVLLRMLKKHIQLFEKTGKNFAILKKFFKVYVQGFPNAGQARVRLMEAAGAKEAISIISDVCAVLS